MTKRQKMWRFISTCFYAIGEHAAKGSVFL
jgi:hypothetical protein